MRMIAGVVVGAALGAGAWAASAATTENFELRNGGDLLALCATKPGEPNYVAAVHACHAYGLGAWQYHMAATSGTPAHTFVCIPEPRPSRDRIVEQFVTWGQANPQHQGEPAVEMLFRFFTETYPCKR